MVAQSHRVGGWVTLNQPGTGVASYLRFTSWHPLSKLRRRTRLLNGCWTARTLRFGSGLLGTFLASQKLTTKSYRLEITSRLGPLWLSICGSNTLTVTDFMKDSLGFLGWLVREIPWS